MGLPKGRRDVRGRGRAEGRGMKGIRTSKAMN